MSCPQRSGMDMAMRLTENNFKELGIVEEEGRKCQEQLNLEAKQLRKKSDELIDEQHRLERSQIDFEGLVSGTKTKIDGLNLEEFQRRLDDKRKQNEAFKTEIAHAKIAEMELSRDMVHQVLQMADEFDNRQMCLRSQKAVLNGIKTKQVIKHQLLGKVQVGDKRIKVLSQESHRLYKQRQELQKIEPLKKETEIMAERMEKMQLSAKNEAIRKKRLLFDL